MNNKEYINYLEAINKDMMYKYNKLLKGEVRGSNLEPPSYCKQCLKTLEMIENTRKPKYIKAFIQGLINAFFFLFLIIFILLVIGYMYGQSQINQ